MSPLSETTERIIFYSVGDQVMIVLCQVIGRTIKRILTIVVLLLLPYYTIH